MTPAAESVSTIPAQVEQREEAHPARTLLHNSNNEESLRVHLDTAPDLLPHLDFAEYEEVYRMWRAGEKTLEELTVQYGAEVTDLLQAQRAVGEAEDADREHLCTRSPDAVSDVELVPLRGRSSLCAPGQPRVRFGFFENMYGQWRSGQRNSQEVLREFGSVWMELFRAWRAWGLDAIYGALQLELDMSHDENDQARASVIPEKSQVVLPYRVPFSAVWAVFRSWKQGQVTDLQVVQRQGEVWLVLFQIMFKDGFTKAVRESLSDLVTWDVTVAQMLESDQVEAATLVLPGEAHRVADTVPEPDAEPRSPRVKGDEVANPDDASADRRDQDGQDG